MQDHLKKAADLLHQMQDSALFAQPWAGHCKYLISLDYDGTLRNAEAPRISQQFIQLMEELRAEGVRWGINTGRKLPELVDEISPFLPYMPDFICTCERYVYLADEQGIIRSLTEANHRCTEHNTELTQRHYTQARAGIEALRHLHPQIEWDYCQGEPFSICANDENDLAILMPHLYALVAELEGLCVQRAGRFMRFSDERYHKGTALQCVAQHWGVAEENLIILGDGHNDLCAFQHFPKAFCASPKMAHPEVIAYLSQNGGYHSSQQGVMEAIEHWRAHHKK